MEEYQNKLAPICLFTYNRLSETQQTVEALKQNYLASESELFIFSDGSKDSNGAQKVNDVRNYLKTIDGFKSVTIYESPTNKGLANSIISGVTQIIEQYGKIIVLEDDLITSPNFLNFMNQALVFYEHNPKIHSVSGYTLDLKSLRNYCKDYYFGNRPYSWGWGTWENKWSTIDWEVKDYNKLKKSIIQKIKFMQGGSDLPQMLDSQMKGRIDSWAIRWCYDQFKKNQVTVFPSKSKIQNIGFGANATHTKKGNRFSTTIDNGEKVFFNFDHNIIKNKDIIRDARKVFSCYARLKNKILN
ncbi:MAG: hypothetical protein PWP52_384 [Bacteroidales bacterium]|nr:hypothetical protein [Bacteroidales bacterium]